MRYRMQGSSREIRCPRIPHSIVIRSIPKVNGETSWGGSHIGSQMGILPNKILNNLDGK